MVKRLAIFAFLLSVSLLAQQPQGPTLPNLVAPNISDPSDITAVYQAMVGQWFSAVSPYAYDIFYALAGLDIAIFGWNLWMTYHGDIRMALMSTANKVMILGFFLALLMNGSEWMADIINMFTTIGKQASGLPSLSPSVLLLQGFKIFGTLLWQAAQTGALFDVPTALALIVAAFIICASFLVITVQFVLTQVQVFLALGMGYLFLGFGGSRWTAPYVERYFAYCFASGTKLMVLYMLAGAAWPLTNAWITKAQNLPFTASGVEAAWAIMCGAILYAVIVWFGSSLVSQIFGGSPNLGHADVVSFMAPMVSAGVTAGMIAAGVATGGTATAAAAAGKVATSAASQSMPTGPTPSQPSAPGSGWKAAAQMAQTGAATAGRMPTGGGHASPPSFHGFNH